jgi:surface carbohydrate biosynthesis protein
VKSQVQVEHRGMRIGLIVDHPKRDLSGAAITAREMVRRGAEAVIVPMYEQGVDVPRLGLNAVVVNYARSANRTLVETYVDAGIKVFVIDTEGGVLGESGGNAPPAFARAIRDNGYGALLSGYLFWGSALRDAFVEAGTMPVDRLHVTGCPRFDFAAPRWRTLLAQQRRGYLLVNANFPLVNPRFSGSQGRERAAMVAAGWPSSYVDRLLADLRRIFPRYLEIIRWLAEARPEHTLLVRPHPFENEEPYRSALGGLCNVRIDGSGGVLEVIHNAAAVLHLNCGTAVEAVLLERLPIHLQFLDTEATASHAKLPARVSRPVAAFEELLAVVDAVAAETAHFPFAKVHAEHIHRFFHDNDGKAAERVAETVVRAAADVRPRPSLAAVIASSRSRPSAAQLAHGLASAALGSAATSELRGLLDRKRRDKSVAPDDVRAVLHTISTLEPLAPPTYVSRARTATLGIPLASINVRAG